MIIYHYDPKTGAYLGKSEADEDPMQPGNYLVPAHATTAKPPKSIEGKIRVFSRNKWANQKPEAADATSTAEAPQVAETQEQKATAARHQRNRLLAATDWRMMPDVTESLPPQTFVELKQYRQALRELPTQKEFPDVINWPELPK